jgi:hypothetical protein
MPIRFLCTHCGQRLSVGTQKAGQTATCPKCKASITVPTLPDEQPILAGAAPEAPPLADPPVPRPADASFDMGGDVEIVVEPPVPMPGRAPRTSADDTSIDYDRIALPRYVIFAQGILLALVGLICFLLGMAVGGAVSESGGGRAETPTPVAITGTVAVAAGANRTPDRAATVVFLPLDAEPEEKTSLEGIRPGDDPAKGVKVRDYIRAIGGSVAFCDDRGQFSLQLAERGRYHLLVISANAPPNRGKPLDLQEVAQIGKYFDLSTDPLADFRYQWRTESVRGSRRINVDFD